MNRTICSWCINLIIVLNLIGCGSSKSDSTVTNAADEYDHLFVEIPSSLAEMCKGIDSMESIDENVSQRLEEYQWLMEEAEKISRMKICDYSDEFKADPHGQLPHRVGFKNLGRVLVADARRSAMDGNSDAAVQRLLTLLRMAHQIANGDRVIVGKFIAYGFASATNLVIYELLDQGMLNN